MNCQGVRRFKDENSDLEQKDVVAEIFSQSKDSPEFSFWSMSTYLDTTLAWLFLRVCKWLFCTIKISLTALSRESTVSGLCVFNIGL